MLRTCKSTLDIAIFAFTNDKLYYAVNEVFKRGVKVRIIADDVCCKYIGCDVIRLCAEGVPCKTDNSVKYHMHHKFAIIDNSVVITGSFNWTFQASKHNQENILFFENKEIAQQYTDEYNRLFESFTTVLDQDVCKKIIADEDTRIQIAKEKKEKEKAKKEAAKAKEKEKKENEKAKKEAAKAKEKEKKEKEKAKKEAAKAKEKEKKEKEKAKKEAAKEKAK